MKINKLKVKNLNSNYSVIIGINILNQISSQIKEICPDAQKIALVVDKNVPTKFKVKLKNYLKKYKLYIFEYTVNEKFKSLINVNLCISFNSTTEEDIFISKIV